MIRKLSSSIAREKIEQTVIENVSKEFADVIEPENNNEAIVGIKLEEILKRPGSKWDLYLEDGDVISIPKELQTVQVTGQVLLPSLVRYDKYRSFEYYIDHSGGFAPSALKRKSYVVYANGETQATRRILFFKKYPDIKPGAKIHVPEKPKRESQRLSIGETVALTSSLITVTALVISLFK
jgi:protein involved in polysaccharide export with SLBB domain